MYFVEIFALMNFTGIVISICVFIFFAYLVRAFYNEWRLVQGKWPEERDGEYEEVRAILPLIVEGKLIWIRRYGRTFVSTMEGGFVRKWLLSN